MVLHRMHSPTKKEKRSKKERKRLRLLIPTSSINFGLVSTYKRVGALARGKDIACRFGPEIVAATKL